MKWVKRGNVFCASHTSDWAVSHAAVPTPWLLNDEVLRIYCAFRKEKNVSRIGYVDVRADNPKEVLGVSARPILDIGNPGTFDDNGVIPVCVVAHEGKLYLYYGGFELYVRIPYTLFSGLAVSSDGGNTFTRLQQTPVIDRSAQELFFRTVPYVLKEGGVWKAWYLAGSRWVEHNGKQLPFYSIQYMESPDGIHWPASGSLCFSPQGGDEHGFGRPYVIHDAAGYHMYYSIRSFSKSYRLGYAQSPDGKRWTRRDDQMGLDVSPEGWDSQTVCYSSVVRHRGKTYLFYNGNAYGETGFGYAELAA